MNGSTNSAILSKNARTNVLNILRLIDRLSGDFKTANYMLISSTKDINVNNIERKPFVKHLGVYTDEHINWEPQLVWIAN